MTTEKTSTPMSPRLAGAGPLVRVLVLAGGAALGLAILVVVLAALIGGTPATYAAVLGSVLSLGIFAMGTVVLHLVARLAPATALLIALMTFVLQVMVMALVFWRLSRSGLLEDGTLDPAWLAIALVVGTVAWSGGQILAVTRARTPVFDLPEVGAR